MSRLYPDYRRAHELRLELEGALQELAEMQCDDGASAESICDQRDTIHDLQRALFLCGVPEPQP